MSSHSPTPPLECRTVGISINQNPDAVYEFVANPANFPRWSKFITAMEKHGDAWRATTSAGISTIRFVPKNTLRVVDHDVTTPEGAIVHVPLRVLPNGPNGSEVIFSVFRQPGMDDDAFNKDIGLVQADLTHLKTVLENSLASE